MWLSQVSEEKIGLVNDTIGLLKESEIIGAADLNKVGSSMLQDLRKRLRGQIIFKVVKNTLMKISMEKADLPNSREFLERISGPNIFIFSSGNPFKMAMMLHRNKVRIFARAGDAAINPIVIPSGNTGLSPGPILSKFGSIGVRTRIEGGNIWVVNDTEVADPGDEISMDLADILARLGMRVSEMGLEVKAVYEDGVIIPNDELILDLEAYEGQLTEAFSDALQVALKAVYPAVQTLPTLMALAAQDARKVAVEAGYISPETAREIITRAHSQALALQRLVQN
jgi:large subunit ribosomal protein L10